MGLFDFLKKKPESKPVTPTVGVKSTVSESEKKYYQDDSYYTAKAHAGTMFEKTVVTFDERKKTAIPSKRGLYPAEILLLEYCSYGTYPRPKNGYPGFWWFEYGIRDVGAALKNLEARGFIALGSLQDSVGSLKVQELKDILSAHGENTTGKKDILVGRVVSIASDQELIDAGVTAKYHLTDVGIAELEENAYVPYMHKHPHKTTEDSRFGMTFNVWSINKLLGCGDKSNWKSVVDAQEQKMNNDTEGRNAAFMENLKKVAPEEYKVLKTQDQQIAACQKAQAKYESDHDLDYYIGFWEHLWNNGGLKFESSRWHFTLPDLYIKARRFDDALDFLKMLKKEKPSYADKADSYITKVEDLKTKAAKK